MTSPFERYYKCKECGELIVEQWNQGVLMSTITTTERMKHLLTHYFNEVKDSEHEGVRDERK